ncbi:MAG: hypothetical protein ACM3ZB_05820 [bacterium]
MADCKSYIFESGTLREIPPVDGLTWGEQWDGERKDYARLCVVPCEYANGFHVEVYEAVSDRAPFPFAARADLQTEGSIFAEIFFPTYPDAIQYLRDHAALLQASALGTLVEHVSEAFEWLFGRSRGLFRDHVIAVEQREARTRARYAQQRAQDARTAPQQGVADR